MYFYTSLNNSFLEGTFMEKYRKWIHGTGLIGLSFTFLLTPDTFEGIEVSSEGLSGQIFHGTI